MTCVPDKLMRVNWAKMVSTARPALSEEFTAEIKYADIAVFWIHA